MVPEKKKNNSLRDKILHVLNIFLSEILPGETFFFSVNSWIKLTF